MRALRVAYDGSERRHWRPAVECVVTLSIIAAERNQTGASRTEDALTAVITHRHGDHNLARRGRLAEDRPLRL